MLVRKMAQSNAKNAQIPSNPASVSTRGYMASIKGPPVTPMPQSGDFFQTSTECCQDLSRSDVDVSTRIRPTLICPSSLGCVNVYSTRSTTAFGATIGTANTPINKSDTSTGLRRRRINRKPIVTTPAARNDARDSVAWSAMPANPIKAI